jgi:ABC-type lipoprotein release transport system permease subunit
MWKRIAALPSLALFVAMLSIAWLFRPFGIGRLVSKVSLPRLREHPTRTSLTLLGVALGVAVLMGVLLVNDSIVRGVRATIDDVAGKADLQLSADASGMDEALLDKLRELPGIGAFAPVTQQVSTLTTGAGKRERVICSATRTRSFATTTPASCKRSVGIRCHS